MTTRVAVTGAAGFVGGFVARWLAARGFAVTAIARRRPVQSSPDPSGLAWCIADVCDPEAFPARFDALVHCAAVLPSSCPDPEPLYRDNMALARAAFERAVAAGARSAVNLSSMSVYGAIAAPVVSEDTQPRDPDPYGCAKRDAEELLAALAARHPLSALSIRLPGTVGRGSHHNFLSDVMTRLRAGEIVRATNPESLFNNIVYVGDLAAFIERRISQTVPENAVTNLASDEALPLREVLALMFDGAGQPARIEFALGGKAPFLIALDHARSLGYRPATVRASIAAMVRDCLAPEGKEGWRPTV